MSAKASLVGAITVTWTKVDGATGYVLERSGTGEAASFTPLKTLGAAETSFRDTELYYSQTAYYRVKATGSGATPYSNVASATTHAENKKFAIMPLGDSNTEGGTPNDPANLRASYRAKLEDLLNGKSIKFDYVGSESTGGSLVSDTDHAGFGGARDEDIALLLRDGRFEFYDTGEYRGPGGGPYLDRYNPDIILLHIGTNWVSGSATAMDDVRDILDEVDKYESRANKEVTVIVARIIRRVCYTGSDGTKHCPTPAEAENTIKYNNMLETYVKERIGTGDRLHLVDMQDGAGLVYKYEMDGGDMNDHLHPTQKGYDKMAPVWFKALDPLLNRELKPTDTVAPETTIAAKPKELSNAGTARFEFSSNESGVTYQVSINGAGFTNAATPYTTNALADGEHTIRVRAIDAAGNIDATPASYTWTIDTKAPAAPIVSAPEEGKMLNNNKPGINGTAEAGSTVNVFIGSTKIGLITAGKDGKWSLVPATALAEGAQQLTATATDAAGNTSNASSTRNFTIDTKAPQTTIASHPGAVSNSSEAKFGFSSNEQHVTYEVSLDGGEYQETGSSYTARGLAEGKHTLAVRATDAAGNTDPSPATHTWEIDTKAPETPTFAGITEDRGPVEDDQVTADNTLRLRGRAEAGAVVAVLEQGNVLGKATARQDGTWEYSHESIALKQGEYTFTATATDAAGNTSDPSKGFAVTIDLTAPKAAITTISSSVVNKAFPISITFTEEVYGLAASDLDVTNATLEDFKSIDRASYTATVVPAADGAVRIRLPAGKLTDLAGNLNTASNLLEATYDASAPQGYAVRFVPEKVDVDNQAAVALEVSGAEKGTTYFYNISSNNGGEEIAGSAVVGATAFRIEALNLSGLADGTLTATLYLVDEVGNRGEEVTAQVEKLTKDITTVHHPADITVKFKTGFDAIGLPDKVKVSYTYGDDEELQVAWAQGDYNSEVPGSYVIIGQMELKENTSNSKHMAARVTVVVEPNQPPTGLTLSTDRFRPDIDPDTMIGTFSTTDPDDEEFTYTLISGQGDEDNSLFGLRNNNELYLKSNRGLSGKSVFNIRVRSTDPYGNVIEKTFALTKSLYYPEGGIELVNAFSPDGDNINDTWLVPELRYYNSIEVQVFDRSGVLLFHTSDPEKGWDGRGKDGRVVAGSYFYVIQVKDINLVQKGVLTVLN
ncbi:Ig-like domain-containing protein [Pontibacter kalidii]|uniref:Ig-like domain-containing protein n=1 Tax=Pontibacter kalidii TaxID=2592049 RepID=UPI00225BA73C|nr:Ig-like domain-containing protein [Pontibacter kalidii]